MRLESLLTGGKFVDDVDQRDCIINRRLRMNPMAEIKDVAGAAGGLIENFFDAAADFGALGQQYGRLQIPLHRSIISNSPPGNVQSNSPIDSNDRPARFRQQWNQCRIARRQS